MPAQEISWIDPNGPDPSDRDLWLELAGPEGRVTAAEGRISGITEFQPDGSIVATPESGPIVTTTFLADGSIQDVYGAPINQTWVTSFGADGSVTREQVI